MKTNDRKWLSSARGCVLSLLIMLSPADGIAYHGLPQSALSAVTRPAPMWVTGFTPVPLFLSAQQACGREAGWQWRAEGVSICFRPGPAQCPVGHPWLKRVTPNFTVCVSIENAAWMSPGMGSY